jgi:hypothetical protein
MFAAAQDELNVDCVIGMQQRSLPQIRAQWNYLCTRGRVPGPFHELESCADKVHKYSFTLHHHPQLPQYPP